MKKRPRGPVALLAVVLILNIGVLVWFGVGLYKSHHRSQAVSILGAITLLAISWFAVYRTRHKHAQDALRESEERFRAIFEKAGNPIVIVDTETLRITDFNDIACENLGYTRDEFAKLSILDINTVESEEDLKKIGQAAFMDGSISFETKHKTKMGEIRDVSVSIAPVGTRDEKSCVSAWQDITEHKKVMEEMGRLAKFPNENPNPVLRISSDGMLIYANQASSTLLETWGCSVWETLTAPWDARVRESYDIGHDRQIETECGDRIFSLTFAPVEGSGFTHASNARRPYRGAAPERWKLVTVRGSVLG